MVVAPSVIRSGLPFAVSLNLLRDIDRRNQIILEIQDYKNKTIASTRERNVQKGKIKSTFLQDKRIQTDVSGINLA